MCYLGAEMKLEISSIKFNSHKRRSTLKMNNKLLLNFRHHIFLCTVMLIIQFSNSTLATHKNTTIPKDILVHDADTLSLDKDKVTTRDLFDSKKDIDRSNEITFVQLDDSFNNKVELVSSQDKCPLSSDHKFHQDFDSHTGQLLSNASSERFVRLKRQIYIPPYQNNQNGYRQSYQNPVQPSQQNQISFVNPTYRQSSYQGRGSEYTFYL